MSARPTEIRELASLLESEHPDAESLARALIERLDEIRAERPFYVAAMGSADATWAYGPMATARQAEKALAPLASTGFVTGPVRVYPVSGLTAPDEGTALRACQGCGHPASAHNWPKSRIKGCVVGEIVSRGRVVRPKCDCEGLA